MSWPCDVIENRPAIRGRCQARKIRFGPAVVLLEALCTALDRRREVLELLATATDPDDALEGLQEKLGLEYAGALAVLDLQLRRLTSSERDRIAAELAEATTRLREVRRQSGN